MSTSISMAKIVKSPIFFALLAMYPAAYPLQLIFSDYLTSEHVVVPFRQTAVLYILGLTAYIYGVTAPYTYETDTETKSVLKCVAFSLGVALLLLNFEWTASRWCYGVGVCG